jgi:hypothetical protein
MAAANRRPAAPKHERPAMTDTDIQIQSAVHVAEAWKAGVKFDDVDVGSSK